MSGRCLTLVMAEMQLVWHVRTFLRPHKLRYSSCENDIRKVLSWQSDKGSGKERGAEV